MRNKTKINDKTELIEGCLLLGMKPVLRPPRKPRQKAVESDCGSKILREGDLLFEDCEN